MSAVHIETVQSRKQRKQFLQFPWDLYRDDPLWIPPLRRNQSELLGYKSHPFHDEAESQTFIARRNGAVCGRIAAIIHRGHVKRYREQRAHFGFFESIDDEEVSGSLFNAAIQWSRDRGMDCIRGPMNPAFHYETGMLIEGFDQSPTFMMTYNPPYYPSLLDRYGGFEKSQDLYAFYGHISQVPQLLSTLDFVVREAKKRFAINVRPLDTSRFRQEIEMFLEIYNLSYQNHWGFVPMSPAEVKHFSSSLRYLIVPELTAIAEVDGKPIGSMFVLPDYNPRIRQIDGRLFPFGFIRLLSNRQAIKRVRIISANVVPEYQKWGVGSVMLEYLVPIAQRRGVEDVEFSWVAESNKLSRLSLENGGAIREKTYRVYDRVIPS